VETSDKRRLIQSAAPMEQLKSNGPKRDDPSSPICLILVAALSSPLAAWPLLSARPLAFSDANERKCSLFFLLSD